MSDYKIKELIFSGVQADPERVRQAAMAATVIITRGNFATEWLRDIGIQGAITLELTMDKQDYAFDAISEKISTLIPGSRDVRVLYVTPLHPFTIDIPGRQLAKLAEFVAQIPGDETLTTLSALDMSITEGAVQALDGLKILNNLFPVFSPALPVVIHLAGINLLDSNIPVSLRQVYPLDSQS
jgi:hypothetical protein